MRLTSSQRGVAIGAAAALIATLAVLAAAALMPAPDPGDRLRLFTLCGLAPALALAIAIARLAQHRFTTPDDIDGSGLTGGTERAKILQALLQNTLEQGVLALPVYGWWALAGPPAALAVVPAAAGLFLLGRVLFFGGYTRGAAGRALGFGLTFYPTVALLAAAIVALLRGY
jgi:hypothetical protein